MRKLGLILFASILVAGCATERQTAGPVGAVVGGAAGAVVTAPRGYRRVYRGPRRAARYRQYRY
jgi:hypothetical protein